MQIFHLFLITVFNILARFWRFATVPPLINSSDLPLRFVSSLINLFIPIALYFFFRGIYKKNKLALLTAFVFSILPQSIIEGRIISALFSQNFSILNTAGIQNFLVNFIELLSPGMFFFKNTTFYWGGIREFGVIYISFIPFFISGIYCFLRKKQFIPLIVLLFIFLLIASSKDFPENRILYFTLPFISSIISSGILGLWKFNNSHSKKILLFCLIFTVYELMQFFHFYFIHYPQAVSGYSDKITYPF